MTVKSTGALQIIVRTEDHIACIIIITAKERARDTTQK